ncbi:hypothetical protein AB0N64_09065 [Microbacterium sp. NPDC089318]
MARTMALVAAAPRVNLLPPSEVGRREREALTGRWIWVGLAALLLSALLVAGAWLWNQFAQQQLAAEQSRTNVLIAQIGGLSEVSGALSTDRELRGYLADAMGSDLAWKDIQVKVESQLPRDVRLVGFDLLPGPPAASKLTEEDASAGVGLRGTVTLDSPNTLEIATVATRLRDIGSIVSSDASALAESTTEPGRFVYTIDVIFDQSIYTARFAANAEEEAK